MWQFSNEIFTNNSEHLRLVLICRVRNATKNRVQVNVRKIEIVNGVSHHQHVAKIGSTYCVVGFNWFQSIQHNYVSADAIVCPIIVLLVFLR